MLIPIADREVLGEYALDALNAVSKTDIRAVLSGGVVRDTLFKRPVKDVDIFVGPEVTLAKLRDLSGEGWEWHGQFSTTAVANYRQYFGAQLREVIIGTKKRVFDPTNFRVYTDNPPVQVIVMDAPVDLIPTLLGFDFGFCQVGLTAFDVNIWATEEFIRDFIGQKATLVRNRRDAACESAPKWDPSRT